MEFSEDELHSYLRCFKAHDFADQSLPVENITATPAEVQLPRKFTVGKVPSQVPRHRRVLDAFQHWATVWWHNLQRNELDRLVNAFVAGHLIECSTYVTGGNFTSFKRLEHSSEGPSDLGVPIAEIVL
jgi:Acyclic terpene utilisation family protein AtuA